ncbi:Hypp1737 [Branchiostoma lanceolatum]|uniref:Hypp1737 protein n=1 Tax=Branchiostoma lanceolatum TaxID=7740 RepID=A0A8J9ZMA8_BRALA|nr:Hypp1737 [Branchiostoma lanceolatum]
MAVDSIVVSILLVLFAASDEVFGADPLESRRADPDLVSISGFSSGGSFAVQYHVAHSQSIMGAGVLAGAPYHSSGTILFNIPGLQHDTQTFFQANLVDDPSNMATDRVYLFHGSHDLMVPEYAMTSLREYYKGFVDNNNIKEVLDVPAFHGFPTADYGGECGHLAAPLYLNNCGYNAAYEVLNHIYGGQQPLTKPDAFSHVAAHGEFKAFDQGEFTRWLGTLDHGFDSQGYVYIPSGCASSVSDCKLHVHFHGCFMGSSFVGDEFARKSGYNEVGELNDIIILYPQIKGGLFAVDASGCWDWTAYTNENYANKNGVQITAIHRMIQRLLE